MLARDYSRIGEPVYGIETIQPVELLIITAAIRDELATAIAERGLALDVPYELTWSCYRGKEPACGTCDSCAFRLQAFRNAGSRDPIEYAERLVFN